MMILDGIEVSWQDIQTYKDGLTVDASGSQWYIEVLAKILPPISEQGFDNSQLRLAKDTYVATADCIWNYCGS